MPRKIRVASATFVRHERSQSNHAHARAKEGDYTLLRELANVRDRDFNLAEEGIELARRHKVWLRSSSIIPCDVYFVSEYVRAQQTAQHLEIPGAEWIVDHRLNERDWGKVGALSSKERDVHYPGWRAAKDAHPYDWLPEGGETLRTHQKQFASFWHEINERYAGKHVYCMCHGEKLQVIQAEIEQLSETLFGAYERTMRTENGCMVQYSTTAYGTLAKRTIDPYQNLYSPWRAVE